MPVLPTDYYRVSNFRFKLTEKGSGIEVKVQKISGLDAGEMDTVDYREGNEPELHHVFLGTSKPIDLTITRALAPYDSTDQGTGGPSYFEDWYTLSRDMSQSKNLGATGGNTGYRKTLIAETLGRLGDPEGTIRKWELQNCVCKKHSWSDLDASGNELQMETVVIRAEAVTVIR